MSDELGAGSLLVGHACCQDVVVGGTHYPSGQGCVHGARVHAAGRLDQRDLQRMLELSGEVKVSSDGEELCPGQLEAQA